MLVKRFWTSYSTLRQLKRVLELRNFFEHNSLIGLASRRIKLNPHHTTTARSSHITKSTHHIPFVAALSFSAFGFSFGNYKKLDTSDSKMGDSSAAQEKSAELIETLRHADQLFDENHYQEAVDVLKKYSTQVPEIKWRLARALHGLSKTVEKKKKEEMVREAYALALQSIEENDQDFAAHKWYAILLDSKNELDGIRERISKMDVVKHHMLEAVRLNPLDPTSRYLLGAFAFNVADMAWYQKKIVSTFFSSSFDSTYEEALDHFLQAESLKADFYHTNKVMIGKCYMQLKDNEKAKHYLTLASNIKVVTEDDKKCKEDADQLLKKL